MTIVKESASIITMMELMTPSWLQLVSPRDGTMAIEVRATVAVSIVMEEAIEDKGGIFSHTKPRTKDPPSQILVGPTLSTFI
jgi:hypothetical protein